MSAKTTRGVTLLFVTFLLLLAPAVLAGERVWLIPLYPSTGFNSDCDQPVFTMPAPLAPDLHFDFIGLHDPDAPASGPDRDAIALTSDSCAENGSDFVATTANQDFIGGGAQPDSRLKNLRSNRVPKIASPDGTRFFLPPEGVLPPPFPPTQSLPNDALTLDQFRGVGGSLKVRCRQDGTAEVRMRLEGYAPNVPLTIWGVWLAAFPGVPGFNLLPVPFGGTPNLAVPDLDGRARFERELTYCPMDTQPNGSRLLVLDVAAHWDGNTYGAVPDLPAGQITVSPTGNPADVFTSVAGAGIITVNQGVFPITVTEFDH